MEIQNQTRWSARKNVYLKNLFSDFPDNTPVSRIARKNLNLRILNEANTATYNNELFPTKFSVRSHTTYEIKTGHEASTFSNIPISAKKRELNREKTFGCFKRNNNSFTQETLRTLSRDTSIKSASTLRSQSQIKHITDEIIKINVDNIKDLQEKRFKTNSRGKSVQISLQSEIERYDTSSKIKRFSPDRIAELIKIFQKAVRKILAVKNVIMSYKQKYDKNSFEALTIFKVNFQFITFDVNLKKKMFNKL
jgi:hypothetical protein